MKNKIRWFSKIRNPFKLSKIIYGVLWKKTLWWKVEPINEFPVDEGNTNRYAKRWVKITDHDNNVELIPEVSVEADLQKIGLLPCMNTLK